MKITQVECALLEYPLPAPLYPSWAPGRAFHTTSMTLIRVHTDAGVSGVGAGPDVGRTGLYSFIELVAPYILGKDPFHVERIAPYLRNAAGDGSFPWGVEIAFWDIIGKVTNQPVYRLWGGYQETLPVYASLAEIPPPDEQIQRLHQLCETGFRAVKLRLRRPNIDDDIAMVARVRQEFGTDLQIMVDANQANVMPSPGYQGRWTYERALKVAQAMQELDVIWLEEPLPRYNLEQLTRLAAAVDIPIAGGELNKGLHEFKALIENDCYDIIQADCAFSEGISQLRKVAAFAEMSYKPFIPHTWSNGIGLGANLHLAAATPNCPWFEYPVDPPAWTIEARDFMVAEPFGISPDGTISVSDQPGFGFDLDEAAIETYTKENWKSEIRA
jgi:D-galactarolactone cycloisomerase